MIAMFVIGGLLVSFGVNTGTGELASLGVGMMAIAAVQHEKER